MAGADSRLRKPRHSQRQHAVRSNSEGHAAAGAPRSPGMARAASSQRSVRAGPASAGGQVPRHQDQQRRTGVAGHPRTWDIVNTCDTFEATRGQGRPDSAGWAFSGTDLSFEPREGTAAACPYPNQGLGASRHPCRIGGAPSRKALADVCTARVETALAAFIPQRS